MTSLLVVKILSPEWSRVASSGFRRDLGFSTFEFPVLAEDQEGNPNPDSDEEDIAVGESGHIQVQLGSAYEHVSG